MSTKISKQWSIEDIANLAGVISVVAVMIVWMYDMSTRVEVQAITIEYINEDIQESKENYKEILKELKIINTNLNALRVGRRMSVAIGDRE